MPSKGKESSGKEESKGKGVKTAKDKGDEKTVETDTGDVRRFHPAWEGFGKAWKGANGSQKGKKGNVKSKL
jgi:hypothetical protein